MASWRQYIRDIRVPQLPAPYSKVVPENSAGFQLLLSAKDYVL